jgi:hypothetical protein
MRADLNVVTLYNTNNSYLLYHFRLGFTTLNVDIGGRNIINSQLCDCGQGPEIYPHFFIDCNIFNEQRQELFNSLDAILINRGLRPPRLSRCALLKILLYGIDPHHPDNRAIFNSLGIIESLCPIWNSVVLYHSAGSHNSLCSLHHLSCLNVIIL